MQKSPADWPGAYGPASKFPPPQPGAVEMITGEPEQMASALVAKIMDAKIL